MKINNLKQRLNPNTFEALKWYFQQKILFKNPTKASAIKKFKVNRGNFNQWVDKIEYFDMVDQLFI